MLHLVELLFSQCKPAGIRSAGIYFWTAVILSFLVQPVAHRLPPEIRATSSPFGKRISSKIQTPQASGYLRIREARTIMISIGNRWMIPGKTGCLPDLRSEEHTFELQSRGHLVCRLLLEKKK